MKYLIKILIKRMLLKDNNSVQYLINKKEIGENYLISLDLVKCRDEDLLLQKIKLFNDLHINEMCKVIYYKDINVISFFILPSNFSLYYNEIISLFGSYIIINTNISIPNIDFIESVCGNIYINNNYNGTLDKYDDYMIELETKIIDSIMSSIPSKFKENNNYIFLLEIILHNLKSSSITYYMELNVNLFISLLDSNEKLNNYLKISNGINVALLKYPLSFKMLNEITGSKTDINKICLYIINTNKNKMLVEFLTIIFEIFFKDSHHI